MNVDVWLAELLLFTGSILIGAAAGMALPPTDSNRMDGHNHQTGPRRIRS